MFFLVDLKEIVVYFNSGAIDAVKLGPNIIIRLAISPNFIDFVKRVVLLPNNIDDLEVLSVIPVVEAFFLSIQICPRIIELLIGVKRILMVWIDLNSIG